MSRSEQHESQPVDSILGGKGNPTTSILYPIPSPNDIIPLALVLTYNCANEVVDFTDPLSQFCYHRSTDLISAWFNQWSRGLNQFAIKLVHACCHAVKQKRPRGPHLC